MTRKELDEHIEQSIAQINRAINVTPISDTQYLNLQDLKLRYLHLAMDINYHVTN